MKEKKVVIGLSGGIDSAVAALLLKESGYHVTGISLIFDSVFDDGHKQHVCRVADDLEIPIYFINAGSDFKNKVVQTYIREHINGLTPSPCSFCNPVVKWPYLAKAAETYNCDYIATGHYIRILNTDNALWIYRGIDADKDQSYFLWNLSQSVLQKTITPLGTLGKNEVTALAVKKGLDYLMLQKESAGLCFARGLTCEMTLRNYLPEIDHCIGQGKVVDVRGKVIGTHNGYPFYTIGQKSGLRLKTNEKLCVKKIIPEENTLVADIWENLYTCSFTISNISSPNKNSLLESKNVSVIIRGFGLNPGGQVRIMKKDHDILYVETEKPAWAPAPGQPAVFYHQNRVMGGGIINEVFYSE